MPFVDKTCQRMSRPLLLLGTLSLSDIHMSGVATIASRCRMLCVQETTVDSIAFVQERIGVPACYVRKDMWIHMYGHYASLQQDHWHQLMAL